MVVPVGDDGPQQLTLFGLVDKHVSRNTSRLLARAVEEITTTQFEGQIKYVETRDVDKAISATRGYEPILLRSGYNNAKLGATVTTPPYEGYQLYSATGVERESCSSACHVYKECYGNNMNMANRYVVDDNYQELLKQEIRLLSEKYPQGVLVRFHVLGDFVSVKHAQTVVETLAEYPNMAAWITTDRHPGTNPESHMDFNGPIKDDERKLNQSIGDYLLWASFRHWKQIRVNFSTPVPNIPGTMATHEALPPAKIITKFKSNGGDVSKRVTGVLCKVHDPALAIPSSLLEAGKSGQTTPVEKVAEIFSKNAHAMCATCGLCWGSGAHHFNGFSTLLHEHGRGQVVVINKEQFLIGVQGPGIPVPQSNHPKQG